MVEMIVKRASTMNRIRKELTPEQADKFDSMKKHKSKGEKNKSS